MKRTFSLLFAASLLVLAGCATQPPVAIDDTYWNDTSKKVGIAFSPLPKATGHKTGSQGLLDIAINEAVADKVDQHLESLSLEEFYEVRDIVAKFFQDKGFNVVVLEESIDANNLSKNKDKKTGYADKDFTALRQEHNIDQLLYFNLVAAGTIRSYYGFIPTSDPKGYFLGHGMLINLDDNKLLWYKNSFAEQPVAGEWDQPDTAYPNLTNAVYKALEQGKANLVGDIIH